MYTSELPESRACCGIGLMTCWGWCMGMLHGVPECECWGDCLGMLGLVHGNAGARDMNAVPGWG